MNIKKILFIPVTVLLTFAVGCTLNPVTPTPEPTPSDPTDPVDPVDPVDPQIVDVWPGLEINSFLNEKGLTISVPSIKISESELLYNAIEEEEDYTYYSLIIKGDKNQEYETALFNAHYEISDGYYKKGDVSVFLGHKGDTSIAIYATSDLAYVEPPEEIPPELKTLEKEISIKDNFGKHDPITSATVPPLTFAFSKNDSSNSPKTDSTNGWKLYLYDKNSMTITCLTEMSKVEFTFGDRIGALSSDAGSFTSNNVWEGDSEELTITTSGQTRFTAIKITYIDPESSQPVIEGVNTIAEVYEVANQISYMPNAVGWYLSTVEVTVEVEAVDTIDSKANSSGYDPNAQGKVLVVDETGYIICSSGMTKNNPISFYQRAKNYLKAGTTQYVVTGHIAFLNGVVEIKVDEYQYNSSLVIEKKYEEYVKNTYSTQKELVNDLLANAKPNVKGYGVNNIIKMTGLTYFNKYNKAGSYLFLDQNNEIVPIFSELDKDRSYLEEGNIYDIIGLETLYYNRPSLRILKVIKNETLSPAEFDLEDAVGLTDLSQFYNLTYSLTDENYFKSGLTVYTAEVYVSRYTDDDYTINTSYYYDRTFKEYTTGSSQQSAVEHKSLAIFNEDLDYNQTFYDYALEIAKTEEECESLKVRVYFTLADYVTAFGKTMWRVNIFENYVGL